ncbi:MAG: ROK family protein [Candidatus Promineifilaceae bacterium]|nr:ROK family protein [Candidatus Promineifilaceae bacterium]
MTILGIDVGGSGIKGALVDLDRGVFASERIRIKTPRPAKPKAIVGVIRELVEQFNYNGPLGVGFPAVVQDGIVLSAANVHDKWIRYHGQERIAAETGCQVRMLNDADAAGTAEMHFGAGRGQRGVVLILTLGTGIGSALFVNGRLVPNTELGHLYLRKSKIDAENYASDRARTDLDLNWKKWAKRLSRYLQHVEMLFSPNLIILGGGVSKKHRDFLPLLKTDTRLVPAQLRNQAGIIGAAMAAAEEFGRPDLALLTPSPADEEE